MGADPIREKSIDFNGKILTFKKSNILPEGSMYHISIVSFRSTTFFSLPQIILYNRHGRNQGWPRAVGDQLQSLRYFFTHYNHFFIVLHKCLK